MRNILIIDTETTGLEPEAGAEIIEIAGVLFNVEYKEILQQGSTFLKVNNNPQYSVNKINSEVTKVQFNQHIGLKFLEGMINESDYLVAHNAEFDKNFCVKSMYPELEKCETMKWIDTYDFDWPEPLPNGKSLVNVALSMGVPVLSAHRALTDCLLIASCFQKIENLQGRLINALTERFVYKALVSFDDKQLAKDAGFVWDRFVPRSWGKRLTENEAAEIKHFKIVKIED